MTGTRLYHAATALYCFWLDQYYFSIAYEILTTREDIVRAHYAGLGLQFFTFWNQIAQQVYCFLVFAEDIIEVGGLEVEKEIKRKLHHFNNTLFTCVVFPSAFVVMANFWLMYSFLENNLIEDLEVIKRHVPNWLNHTLHTNIILLPVIELLLSYKPYPSRAKGILSVFALVMAYTIWVIFAKVVGGRWPYPFMSLISTPHKLYYWSGNFLLSVLSYLLGELVNFIIWGSTTGLYTTDVQR